MNRPERKSSPRLKGYDYSQPGGYFITICTYQRECSLGEVYGNRLIPSPHGEIVQRVWFQQPDFYPGLALDYFTLMPNHIHGILFLTDESPPGADLSKIIRDFKSWSARRINEHRDPVGVPVWQRSFYDRIIRNEKELQHIREYIQNNPLKWALDRENPKNFRKLL